MNKIITITQLLLILITIEAQTNRDNLDCNEVKCPDSFRCQEGMCLRQQKQAKKSICFGVESDKNIQAIRCTTRTSKCEPTNILPSCGFTQNGFKKDFTNDCQPCRDANIEYFYRQTCSKSPIVCSETQQCLNGKCVEMYNTPADSNLKICNSSNDCKPIVQICVANKCVNKMDLFLTLQKSKSNKQ